MILHRIYDFYIPLRLNSNIYLQFLFERIVNSFCVLDIHYFVFQHKNFCKYEKAEIDGETTLAGVEGRTIDLTVTLENGDFTTFSMKLAANDEYETNFTYHKECGMLEIDRTYCGVTKDIVCVRKIKISDPDGLKTMRFILDRQSIELFINDGQQVATTAICTPQEAKGISFFSDRKMWINVEKYDIVKPA